MEKKKIGVLFIDETPKTTRDGGIYLTGIPEGDDAHSLIAYKNTSKNGKEYWAIYIAEKDPRYTKKAQGNQEGDSNFSNEPTADEDIPFDEDLPF